MESEIVCEIGAPRVPVFHKADVTRLAGGRQEAGRRRRAGTTDLPFGWRSPDKHASDVAFCSEALGGRRRRGPPREGQSPERAGAGCRLDSTLGSRMSFLFSVRL